MGDTAGHLSSKGSPHEELSDDKLKRIVTRITDIRIDARHSDDS